MSEEDTLLLHLIRATAIDDDGGCVVPDEWVDVPYYPNGVRAGVPMDAGDDNHETIAVPRAFAADIRRTP